MKSICKYIMALGIAAGAFGASAQNTASGYFLDDYMYRYQINPAIGNTKGFVSFPGLGNLNVGVNGNLHLKSLIYSLNGQTVSFLHPGITPEEVLGSLHDRNNLNVNSRIDIVTVGFKALGGYNTVNVGVRTDVGMRMPKTIFSFLKEGVTNKTYDIRDLGAFANAYGEISFNHSRDIKQVKGLRVGASVKVLLGAGNISARFDRATLDLGVNDWTITSNATIESRVKGLTYNTDYSEETKRDYVSGLDIDGPGINGFGLAFDLGAVYTLPMLSDLTVSAAVTDLGFIRWNNNMVASTNGERTFNTDRYTFSADDNSDNSFENTGDRIKEDIMTLYQLDDNGDQGGVTTPLGVTVNIGAEYKLPVWRKLSFGLLNTTRIQKNYGWTNFRLSANVMPCKVFDASVNAAMGTYGFSFGWLANLHVTGFNLFLGMDHTPTKLAKQGVPLNSNMQFNFGLNFPF